MILSNIPFPSPHLLVSKEMEELFSQRTTYLTWRRLWIALAEAQQEMGVAIEEAQIQAMRRLVEEIPSLDTEGDDAIFTQLQAFKEQCPDARHIVGLGATASYVRDNGLLLSIHKGLTLLLHKGVQALREMHRFAKNHFSMPCLSESGTSATTVGKRISLWAQDLLLDMFEVERRISLFRFLGNKGEGGTQYALITLLGGNAEKVQEFELRIAGKMGFSRFFSLSGDHYPAKQDQQIIHTLSEMAATMSGIAKSIVQWMRTQEIDEQDSRERPFPAHPMTPLSHRMLDISSWMGILTSSSTNVDLPFPLLSRDQRFRSLFSGCDALFSLLIRLVRHLTLHPGKMEQRLMEEIPYWASEEIVRKAMEQGGAREDVQQKMRLYQQTALHQRKRGKSHPHPLLSLLEEDSDFPLRGKALEEILAPERFIGQSARQVQLFFERELEPFVAKYASLPNPMP